MSGSTANQGYPYPLTSDFADVQDAFQLASAIDVDVRAEQDPFRAFLGRPSFVVRQTSNGSGYTTGSQTFSVGAVDWDNTGGIAVGANQWTQPVGQQPSWWMFGATLLTAIISGTPVVGDMNMARLNVNTTDQVSGLVSTTSVYQRNDETNTNGEWMNVFTLAPIYRGSVNLTLILNGSTSKAISAGSTLWGLYLGPVI